MIVLNHTKSPQFYCNKGSWYFVGHFGKVSDLDFSADVAVATVILTGRARSLFLSTFINLFTSSAGTVPGKASVNTRSERLRLHQWAPRHRELQQASPVSLF